jgi:hypothetical protein
MMRLVPLFRKHRKVGAILHHANFAQRDIARRLLNSCSEFSSNSGGTFRRI